MSQWDYTTDILIAGSGAGGLTAGIMAKDSGCDAIVIEKASVYGGSTALSGGAIWVPCNHLMKKNGYEDSPEDAFKYLKTITKGMVSDDRLHAYLDTAVEMTRHLEEHSHVKFKTIPDYPDYYCKVAGSRAGGRTIEPEKFNSLKLPKKIRKELRITCSQCLFFGKLMFDAYEGRLLMGASLVARLRIIKMFAAFFLNPFRSFAGSDTYLSLGSALIGRLRMSLEDRNVPVWLNTSVKRVITENDRVIGVTAEKEGKPVCIKAEKGVILATGGFDKNQAMRKKYQKEPVSADWSMGIPENTGDAVTIGLEIGAKLELMDEAWWIPTTLVPGHCMPWYTKGSWWTEIARKPGSFLPWFNIVDRAFPGSIIVNSKGRRFVNEAAPYLDFTNGLFECHRKGEADCVPSYQVVDHRFYKKYPMGPIMPGFPVKKYLESGFLKRCDTIKGLAKECGIDPEGLADEVKKVNEFAGTGKDPDFHKGDMPIDTYYSDPDTKLKNPCLGTIDKPPFYAIRVFPGDLGTKGGLKTDADARVLREDGSVIDGLYATGNCAASVMGDTYPGAGGTIAPSMVFGWRAAKHASKK